MAQTFNCTRCHDHKFDPFTQGDFYSLKAFFHNVSEKGVGDYEKPAVVSSPPFLPLPTPDVAARIAAIKTEIEQAKQDQSPAAKNRLAQLTKSLTETEKTIPVTLVMDEATPRDTFILLRGEFDQPSAALVEELKERGLLDDTLVIWGGEFGRSVYSQGQLTETNYGRDHHPRCFSLWLTGGGVKRGTIIGETDDFSYKIIKDTVHIHDLNATALHLVGIDHTRLIVRNQGRDYRLTDVQGKLVKEILA